MPRLAPHFLDCAVFLYRTEEDARAGNNSGGTGFFFQLLSPRFPTQAAYYFVVSNWHTVCRDGFPVVRVPLKAGGVDVFDLDSSEWHFVAGGYDVAVAPVPIDPSKHRVMVGGAHGMITREAFAQYQIGLGEDVFMIGRFVDHHADVPTVRFGNISMLPTPIEQENGAVREAYCLDMRSRSGYSGSPVFVYRTPGFDMVDGKDKDGRGRPVFTGEKLLLLLGVHWGQFNEYWKVIEQKADAKSEAALAREGQYIKGLSGMTCVAPAWAIMETIENTKLKDLIAAADERLAAELPLGSGCP
jgi:hypothetical protein